MTLGSLHGRGMVVQVQQVEKQTPKCRVHRSKRSRTREHVTLQQKSKASADIILFNNYAHDTV